MPVDGLTDADIMRNWGDHLERSTSSFTHRVAAVTVSIGSIDVQSAKKSRLDRVSRSCMCHVALINHRSVDAHHTILYRTISYHSVPYRTVPYRLPYTMYCVQYVTEHALRYDTREWITVQRLFN